MHLFKRSNGGVIQNTPVLLLHLTINITLGYRSIIFHLFSLDESALLNKKDETG